MQHGAGQIKGVVMVLEARAQLLYGWLGVSLIMGVLWLIQWRRRDAGIVDVGWAANLGLLAIFYALTSAGDPARRGLVALLAALWSFRLAGYLLLNRVVGKPEDGRYQTLRAGWGHNAQVFFFGFFQAQALLDGLFSLPFWIAIHHQPGSLRVWEWSAITLWIIAVLGEAHADAQLAGFRADPGNRGRTCRVGWWRYSRHPNYFFEWLHWWVYVLLAVGSKLWMLTLIGPGFMLLFLFRLTGIPYTEKQALVSRGEDYREYQRTTSVFIPWFPKRGQP